MYICRNKIKNMKHRIFTLGESVLDIVFEHGRVVSATSGGAMLNTAVSLGRLDCKTFLISELSDDLCGNLILKFLQENNVNTDFVTVHKSGKTTVAMAFLNEVKDAEYDFYRFESKMPAPFVMPDFEEGDLLLFGSFYSLNVRNRDNVLNIISVAKKKGTLILYDPNIRKAHCPLSEKEKKWILENIALSDIVRGSDKDFENIFGTGSLNDMYNMVRRNGCRHLFLTKGANGAWFKNRNMEYFHAIKQIQPISSIGTGDTFNAGILYEISRLLPDSVLLDDLLNIHIEIIMKTASKMAAEVCMSIENYIGRNFPNL